MKRKNTEGNGLWLMVVHLLRDLGLWGWTAAMVWAETLVRRIAALLSALVAADRPIDQPSDLPERWREYYEERAAIREYGGQAREHAEAEALRETVEAMRREGRRV